MNGEAKKEALHVALFPWLAFGHMIPFLEIAKHLARRGHKVSFISTPRNIQRLPKIPPNLSPLITFVPLPLPRVENLPENAEATSDMPIHLIPHLFSACDGLQDGVSNLLESQTPDWLIYDFNAHWLPAIATKLGISQASFSVLPTSALCYTGPIKPELVDRYRAGLNRKKAEDFTVVPEWVPFPCRLAHKPFEAKIAAPADGQEEWLEVSFWVRSRTTAQGCHVYLTRSSRELEGEWLGLFQELCGKPVVPLGLLLPPLMVPDQEQDQDQDWSRIAELLDKQPKGSVVYVAFGSEVNPSQQDITEMALGLELSGLPFFWALRKPMNATPESPAVNLIPDGFEDRVKGRGHVWRGWAPQHKILAHESVGGFFTHCGWGSVLEGLYYGHPFIMFPVAYEQGLTARVWEDRKVGVEVPRDEEDGSVTRNSLAETLRLVVVDEEGKIYRDTAKKYGAILKRDHYREMDTCIDYLEMHRPHATSC